MQQSTDNIFGATLYHRIGFVPVGPHGREHDEPARLGLGHHLELREDRLAPFEVVVQVKKDHQKTPRRVAVSHVDVHIQGGSIGKAV